MSNPPANANPPTESQRLAVEARGNVLVMAGAGTGKTKTLVDRCLHCLEHDGARIDELLVVTFTEAAAAEMRARLRRAIETKAEGDASFWAEQLARFDLAHIGTLHSFCLKLVREHFYELGLDPQLAILDDGEARQLADETLDAQFAAHYESKKDFSPAVQELIQVHGNGRDDGIRKLILRLHHYSQARPNAAGWLKQQRETFSSEQPADWENWLMAGIESWRSEWLPALESFKQDNEKAAELAAILTRLGGSRESASETLAQILSTDGNWPAKRKTILRKPLEKFFNEAKFLHSLAEIKNGRDPLVEDWAWVHGQMETLLRLAEEFAENFSAAKRAQGAVDFHDLEQFSLKLLWDFAAGKPTSVADNWRSKLKFVFVDEYQDINAAQDKIIQGLSRDEDFSPSPLGGERVGVRGEHPSVSSPLIPALSPGGGEGEDVGSSRLSVANRFLVGDVKQSIYRFRLADPQIFRDYARDWHGSSGRTIPLSENFRSREGLLNLVNSVCGLVMRAEIGGVTYDKDARLKFGAPEKRVDFGVQKDAALRAELLVRHKNGRDQERDEEESELAGLGDAEREARLVAWRLKQLVEARREIFDDSAKRFRPVEWRDIAILLRATRGKSEIFAKEFERAGIPLAVTRGGFYESAEILDLLSLLQLLDNPLQDVPCIAVLRSPLVGLSLDELAEIRLAAREKHYWTTLNHWAKAESEKRKVESTFAKVSNFLERFARWRSAVKHHSLSQCLEQILAETFYADWLRAQPRGAQRAGNVAALLNLAQAFDQFQRQGLFRFLKFIEAEQAAEVEPEVAAPMENAVRLMSIHQSKGLEFPVVVLPDLAKKFNQQDLSAEIIFDEEFGLCPKIKPPDTGGRYPSLPHWLAQRRQRRELRGEELRLLYVALTRARDNLILTASISETDWEKKWLAPQTVSAQKIAAANSYADWLALWFGVRSAECGNGNDSLPELRWQIVTDGEFTGAPGDIPSDLEPLPETDKAALNRPAELDLKNLQARLAWNYPAEAATRRKAKSSVTALRREADELDEEAEQTFPAKPKSGKRKAESGKTKLSAQDVGLAHHKFLEHVALEKTDALAAEADRLARENYLSAEERAALNLAALEKFWSSDLGRKISAHAADVRRELPFTARFSPKEIAAIIGRKPEAGLDGEFIVVQGVADMLVILPGEFWLVDFKTDDVSPRDLPDKIKTYTPQLQLYAAALEKIFRRRVTTRVLHFLATGRTEQV